jgi:hypothetical protein
MLMFSLRSHCTPAAAMALTIAMAGCSATRHEHCSVDCYADSPGYGASFDSGPVGLEPYVESPVPAPPVEVWPGNHEGLIYSLPVGSADGLELRGKANRADNRQLELTHGAALVQNGAAERLLSACRDSNELTIEALLIAGKEKQSGPARIVTFSTDSASRNFTLGQEGDKLILRLRTPKSGLNGMPPEVRLAKVTPGTPQHIIVSYRPGLLVCFLNGEEVVRTDEFQGDFSNWSPHSIVLGDELSGDRDWSGSLSRVALRCRFVEASEAGQLHRLLMQDVAGQ